MMDTNKSILGAVKTGKVLFGANNALKNAKFGRAKMIIMAANCPQNTRKDIEYYCRLSKIPLIFYDGTSIDLSTACGSPFMVSILTVREVGDSDILSLTKVTERSKRPAE